jgi:hypothetical protein
MKTIHWFIIWLIVVIFPTGCKDKYISPVIKSPTDYLVVEGFINTGSGPTGFTLSRATGLDSPYVLPEYGASLSVESTNGDVFPLTEQGNGRYTVDQLTVDFSQQYRLHIITGDRQEYLSDFSSPKLAPPIDSISWKATADGVWIYVTTHDPSDLSRYYQWKYDETWEYAARFTSYIKYLGSGQFATRTPEEMIHICYMDLPSSTIAIGSSEKLKEDILYEYPLVFIPYATSDKLVRKYSILVKQYVLTKDWFEWESILKKNTEQLGSIFDAQPSDISGNIHNIYNPKEKVLGFVGCTSETEKRIFISRSELPQTYIYTGYEDCVPDTVLNSHVADYFDSPNVLPISDYYVQGFLVGRIGSTQFCVDCRIRGGVVTKPDFWQ